MITENLKEIGKKIKCMEEDISLGKMVAFIMVTT